LGAKRGVRGAKEGVLQNEKRLNRRVGGWAVASNDHLMERDGGGDEGPENHHPYPKKENRAVGHKGSKNLQKVNGGRQSVLSNAFEDDRVASEKVGRTAAT